MQGRELLGQLEESEERYRSIVELSPDAIAIHSEGRYVFTNPAAVKLFGAKDPNEILGKKVIDLVHPDYREFVGERIKYIEGKKYRTPLREMKMLRLDESTVDVEAAATPIIYMGKPATQVIIRDITERKQLEEALLKSHDELENRVRERTAALERAGRALRMLYECNQIIVHAADEMDFLREICRTIVEVGGYRMAWVGFAEQDRKKTVHPVAQAGYEEGYLETLNITWTDTERGRGPTGTAVRTGKPSIGRNFLTDPDFEPWRAEALKRGYASSISIPMITDGRTLGALTMYAVEPDAFDIEEVKLLKELTDDIAYCISALHIRAEHKRAEEELIKYQNNLEGMVEKRTQELKKVSEELARSNADLQQFAYVASHDLKEPLRTIAGFVGLLAKRYKNSLDEKTHEYIKYSIDGAKRMQDLITDLLEYCKVGTKGTEFQATDSSLILSKTISNLSAAIEESGAVVTYDKLPTVMGDPSQLSSLFQNLIGNAIKYRGKETPRVHVSAEEKANEWVFSVRDNGIGIDPKFKDRIFAVFQRLHTSGEYSGTGIGLAICKKIVELHGGKIWVESEPGRGSTFYITIPANS